MRVFRAPDVRIVASFNLQWPTQSNKLILKITLNSRGFSSVLLAITKVGEFWIARMGGLCLSSMLYWAPVLLCSGGDLLNIGDNAIAVGAIGAIKLFNSV